ASNSGANRGSSSGSPFTLENTRTPSAPRRATARSSSATLASGEFKGSDAMNPGKRSGCRRTRSAIESRQNLAVLRPELFQPPESDVEVVEERNVEPALHRASIGHDLLQPREEGRREDVVEDVDFEHQCPVAIAAICAGSDGGTRPRQTMWRSG